jgi:hypothetical protein
MSERANDPTFRGYSWTDHERELHQRGRGTSTSLLTSPKTNIGMSLFGFAKDGEDFLDLRDKAIKPVSDAPPSAIKLIDNDSEVQWRKRTPQEIERDKASVEMRGTILGTGLTRNFVYGQQLGRASRWLATSGIENGEVPQDFYIRRGDINALENELQTFNQKWEDIRAENQKPYGD